MTDHSKMLEVVTSRDVLLTMDLLTSNRYLAMWECIFHKNLLKDQRDLNCQVGHRALPVQVLRCRVWQRSQPNCPRETCQGRAETIGPLLWVCPYTREG